MREFLLRHMTLSILISFLTYMDFLQETESLSGIPKVRRKGKRGERKGEKRKEGGSQIQTPDLGLKISFVKD